MFNHSWSVIYITAHHQRWLHTSQYMISVVKTGSFVLIETKEQTKILTLDGKETFAWVNVKNIGEILVASHKDHMADAVLSVGNYRMYSVEDEPLYSDQLHLELAVGGGLWQGYLLPTGLPKGKKLRNRIIPTKEVITKSMTKVFLDQ